MAKLPDLPYTDLNHPDWHHGRVGSTAAKERWLYLGFALFWNAVAQPIFWLLALKEKNLELWKIALVALFPLVGFWLLYLAAIKWLQWRRFGQPVLEMDPFPGSLGGEVGGTIELPLRYRMGRKIDVSLSCVHEYVSGSGKNRSRHEQVLWRERGTAFSEMGLRGTRIKFKFAVPEEQPPTSAPSSDCIKWVVHIACSLAGADLDQTFKLLVLKTETPLRSRLSLPTTVDTPEPRKLPASLVRLSQTPQGLRILYPISRNRGAGMAMFIFGLAFTGFPALFLLAGIGNYGTDDAFGMIFTVFSGFFVVVFLGVGLLILALGLYALFNSLEVIITPEVVISRRRWLGIPVTRTLARRDIDTLVNAITGQGGQGAKATVQYRLEALAPGGQRVRLGDSIKGRPLARYLMQAIGEALGKTEWIERSRRFGLASRSKR